MNEHPIEHRNHHPNDLNVDHQIVAALNEVPIALLRAADLLGLRTKIGDHVLIRAVQFANPDDRRVNTGRTIATNVGRCQLPLLRMISVLSTRKAKERIHFPLAMTLPVTMPPTATSEVAVVADVVAGESAHGGVVGFDPAGGGQVLRAGWGGVVHRSKLPDGRAGPRRLRDKPWDGAGPLLRTLVLRAMGERRLGRVCRPFYDFSPRRAGRYSWDQPVN